MDFLTLSRFILIASIFISFLILAYGKAHRLEQLTDCSKKEAFFSTLFSSIVETIIAYGGFAFLGYTTTYYPENNIGWYVIACSIFNIYRAISSLLLVKKSTDEVKSKFTFISFTFTNIILFIFEVAACFGIDYLWSYVSFAITGTEGMGFFSFLWSYIVEPLLQ